MSSVWYSTALPHSPENDWRHKPMAMGAAPARRPAPAHGGVGAEPEAATDVDTLSTNPLFLALLKNNLHSHR